MAPREKQDDPNKPSALRQVIRDATDELKVANKELSHEVKELSREVLRLANAVYGDEEAGHNGLVSDNKSHIKYIKDNELRQSKLAGYYGALCFLGAGFVVVIKELWHKIFG